MTINPLVRHRAAAKNLIADFDVGRRTDVTTYEDLCAPIVMSAAMSRPRGDDQSHQSTCVKVPVTQQTTIPFGGLAVLSRRVHISRPTPSTWRQKVEGYPAWRSSRRAYAVPQRIFMDAQEEQFIHKTGPEFLANHAMHGAKTTRVQMAENLIIS
jgi:hypothetical protein